MVEQSCYWSWCLDVCDSDTVGGLSERRSCLGAVMSAVAAGVSNVGLYIDFSRQRATQDTIKVRNCCEIVQQAEVVPAVAAGVSSVRINFSRQSATQDTFGAAKARLV